MMKDRDPGVRTLALDRLGQVYEKIRARRLERAGVPALDVARARRG